MAPRARVDPARPFHFHQPRARLVLLPRTNCARACVVVRMHTSVSSETNAAWCFTFVATMAMVQEPEDDAHARVFPHTKASSPPLPKTPFPLMITIGRPPPSTNKARSEEGRARVRRRAAADKVCVLVCVCTFVCARVCTCVQHPSRVHVGGSGFCTQRVGSG